ncbi:MAG: hypothetical protein WCH96_14410 [Betaproteobacteria bacterium]
MALSSEEQGAEAKMDVNNLYREEIVTDRRVGTLRMMTPIKGDGSLDEKREVIFMGEAQIMTQAGPMPINFEIEAKSLTEAVVQFAEAAQQGVEKTVRELQELRRQQSSSIVVPGSSGMGGGLGSKLQLP